MVHRPPRRRRDRQFGSTLEVLGGHDIDEGVEDRAEETRLPEIFQVDDEEDEDDDDLLSFVAFSKNRGA